MHATLAIYLPHFIPLETLYLSIKFLLQSSIFRRKLHHTSQVYEGVLMSP